MAKIKKVESQVDGEQPTIIVLDDGTEVNLEEIDGGFMRQSDYTKKTQALADQKKALETAQVNQQVDTTINSQPEATNGNADMTVKNITEKLKTVLSLVLPLWEVVLSYGMRLWKMVQSFIVSQLRLLFNVVMNPSLFHPRDLMNWNFGILLVIILLLLVGLF